MLQIEFLTINPSSKLIRGQMGPCWRENLAVSLWVHIWHASKLKLGSAYIFHTNASGGRTGQCMLNTPQYHQNIVHRTVNEMTESS